MGSLPDPGGARTLDEFVEKLRSLRVWAGSPSYDAIKERVNASWAEAGRPSGELTKKATVVDCFKTGRRRLNTDLVVAVVQALHADVGYITQWRQALRVIGGEIEAAAQVRVQDTLPPDLAVFTGRTPELDQLRQALHHTQHDGEAVVISAIEGMAGVGKTQLAVHAGHLLARERQLDRVLFVNLRGFHPDPTQPPADPAAVLDGFLRLLGVPGQQIPHDLAARTAAYRRRLAGTHALVVLDNAADAEQVRPLLAGTPGSLTLVTSRRSLTDLQPATRLSVDVFTPEEAIDFLTRAVPEVAVGADPHAAARIADRCGYLPLALSLVAGHVRSTPGWTLTDHADRLDECHHHRRLDSGVQLALDLSYQRLPTDRQRLLRLVALHPGQDFDVYAAAALTAADLTTTGDRLHDLCSDHLLQQAAPGRYSFHDLVRAYAMDRAVDQDRPPERRAALTGLFDFYLATAATAMDVVYPHERQRRATVQPARTATPELSEKDRADRWLDAELANLLAAAQHAAAHGWPEHTWQLSAILDRHLLTRSRYRDAQTLHRRGLHLARHLGNQPAEMNALNGLGYVDRILGRYEQAASHFGRALHIAQDIGDRNGELQSLSGFGHVRWMLGRHEQAGDHYERALQIAQDIGDRVGEVNALNGLGYVHRSLGRYEQATGHFTQAFHIAQDIGDRVGDLDALNGLGHVHRMLGRYEQATGHFTQALHVAQDIGDRAGERHALNGLGHVHQMLGRYDQARDHFERVLRIAQDLGDRNGELHALNGIGRVLRTQGCHAQAVNRYQRLFDLAQELGNSNWQYEALQGLGRLHHATGRPDLALVHHQQALQLATDLAQPADQARALDGLAQAHHTLNHHDQARRHWQHALGILTSLGTDRTEEPEASVPNIHAHLTNLDQQPPTSTV
ncbi:ATP-binding protein [Allorhizocola rhizosphaerae]|uniref:ATP-binding protein n=1 Tax=Allorhizocola rhizosphaerae TaxID=1872709 RepID=UPI001FEBB8EF|nr:tetratricopeptide repeat protein [Allorhizocola rhizosphaerae]